jgi:V/A-type H+-transporting ATPase subunit D
MSQRLKIPPTKSALLALKRQVAFLEQGHDLLERKRELLQRLVYERLAQYRALRRDVERALEAAFKCLGVTHMRMGDMMLRQVSLGLKPSVNVNILPRSALGVEYPSVTVERQPLQPIGLMWTDASLDDTRSCMVGVVALLARLGEAETALWRLLAEQRKTQKRVNALKYNVIPRYQNTIRFIQASLEEEERNTLFQIKVLREQEEREKPSEAGSGS